MKVKAGAKNASAAWVGAQTQRGPPSVSVRQARLIQKVAPRAILDLDHPKIRIHLFLPGQARVDLGLLALGQYRPMPRVTHQVKAALIDPRLPVQRVHLDQNRPGRVIAMGSDEGGNIGQPQPRKIGLNPELRGQARHPLPSLNSSPISEYRSASSSQLGRTLTCVNRCTRRPRNSSSSVRAAWLTALIVSPFLPRTIPLCPSRVT